MGSCLHIQFLDSTFVSLFEGVSVFKKFLKAKKVDHNSYKTVNANKTTVEKSWVLVDAKDQVLGRVASQIARVLRGKHKPSYTPNVDTGDHVVIINSSQVQFTRNKFKEKIYYHHTGYPGGLKAITAEHLHAKKPTEILSKAIRGMLPKCTLGKQMAKKLRIYSGAEHTHQAQNPTPLAL